MNRLTRKKKNLLSNTFRTVYKQLSEEETNLLNHIKSTAEVFETWLNLAEPNRYNSLAKTALEESVMWAVKGITS